MTFSVNPALNSAHIPVTDRVNEMSLIAHLCLPVAPQRSAALSRTKNHHLFLNQQNLYS